MNEKTRIFRPAAWFLAIVALVFVASAGAADLVADGLSEERTGVVDWADARGGLIAVDGRTFQLVDDQNTVLTRLTAGSNAASFNETVDIGSIEAGDRIRYAVDLMSARSGEGSPVLFVLGVE